MEAECKSCVEYKKEIMELEDLVRQMKNAENNEIDEWRSKAKAQKTKARDWEITGKALSERCGEYIDEIKELKRSQSTGRKS